MEVFFGWVILSILVGVYAGNKGRSGWGFFFLALLLSPLIGILVALLSAPNRAHVEQRQIQSGTLKKCPFCAELVKVEAVVCRFCGKDLPAEALNPIPASPQLAPAPPPMTTAKRVAPVAFFGTLVAAIGALAYVQYRDNAPIPALVLTLRTTADGVELRNDGNTTWSECTVEWSGKKALIPRLAERASHVVRRVDLGAPDGVAVTTGVSIQCAEPYKQAARIYWSTGK